jgi:hypothetical protein
VLYQGTKGDSEFRDLGFGLVKARGMARNPVLFELGSDAQCAREILERCDGGERRKLRCPQI